MKFSLMIPTRKRPKKLELFIRSIFETTFNRNEIEIRVGGDNDDQTIKATIERLKKENPGWNLYLHQRPRGNSLVSHYINWLALNFCTGKYIITLNDDCLFRSKNWDIKTYLRLEEYLKDKPDGIVLGVTKDTIPIKYEEHEGYLVTGFPLISKKSVEVLDFFLDPIFMDATADYDICQLYATIGRSVDLTDIFVIEHNPKEFEGLDNNYKHERNIDTDYKVIKQRHPDNEIYSLAKMRFRLDKRILILFNHIMK